MTDNNQEDKNNKSFEKLYLKERKKSQLFVMVVVVLSILLVGSVVFNFQNQKQPTEQDSNQIQGFPRSFGQNSGGFQGSRGILEISGFLNEDGSVDTDQISQIKDNLPDGFEDRFISRVSSQIDNAVKEGEITSEQGEELKAAFGTFGATNAN